MSSTGVCVLECTGNCLLQVVNSPGFLPSEPIVRIRTVRLALWLVRFGIDLAAATRHMPIKRTIYLCTQHAPDIGTEFGLWCRVFLIRRGAVLLHYTMLLQCYSTARATIRCPTAPQRNHIYSSEETDEFCRIKFGVHNPVLCCIVYSLQIALGPHSPVFSPAASSINRHSRRRQRACPGSSGTLPQPSL